MLNALFKEFSRKAVLTYARTITPRNYLGAVLFPTKTINELTFEYFKNLNLLPVMANVQAFGAESEIASRDGVEKVKGEIPPIKRKIPLDEKALIALKRAGAGDYDFVKNTLYNDIGNMVDSIWARTEKMRMDAIASGQIALDGNGVKVTIDYGVPAGLKADLDAHNDAEGDWDQVNAEPITQMMTWKDAIVAQSGIAPTRAVTSSHVVSHLLQNAQVRKMIWGDNGAARATTLNDVNALLSRMDLPQIAVYDLQVREQAAAGTYTTTRLFPEKKFVMLPPNICGDTLIGPSAEALLDPEVSAQDMAGIYAIVTQETDPPTIWTKAAGLIIPTFPAADQVFQAVVLP